MEALNARWSKAVADAERERADGSLESRAALAEALRALDAAVAGAFSRALATEEETASGRFPSRTSPRSAPNARAPGAPPWTTASRSPRTRRRETRAREPADGAGTALLVRRRRVGGGLPARPRRSPETQRKPDRSLDSLPADVVAPATRARATGRAPARRARRGPGVGSARALPPRSRRRFHERDAVIAEGPPSARTSPRRSGARRTPSTSRRRRGRRRWRRGRRPRRRAS